MKKKLEIVKAEKCRLEDKADSVKKEIENLKVQLSSSADEKENQHPSNKDYLTQNEALAMKVKKFSAHSEYLEKKCNLLKEENKEIARLRNELEKVNVELQRVNADFQETLEMKADCKSIKDKYKMQKGVNESLRQSSKNLEYEKNRQISYLEGENLKYLRELKVCNKEIQILKTQRHADVIDEPTEDLGSVLSSFKVDDKRNARSESNKENNFAQTSAKKASLNSMKLKGLGRVAVHDDDSNESPGECNQS